MRIYEKPVSRQSRHSSDRRIKLEILLGSPGFDNKNERVPRLVVVLEQSQDRSKETKFE